MSGWLGRRTIFLISAPLGALGWLLIGVAQDHAMLIIGRIITSLAVLGALPSIGKEICKQ